MLANGRKGFVIGGGWTGFEVVGATRAQTEPGLEWHATKDLICQLLLFTTIVDIVVDIIVDQYYFLVYIV